MTYADVAKVEDAVAILGEPIRPDVTLTPVRGVEDPGSARGAAERARPRHRRPPVPVRRRAPRACCTGRSCGPRRTGRRSKSIDLSAATAMDDVVVVREGPFVGFAAPVLAPRRRRRSRRSRERRPGRRRHSPSSNETLFEHLRTRARRDEARTDEKGSTEKALQKADRVLSESYRVAFIQHAPMEPRAAVAEWNGDRLTVWAGCDGPFRAQQELGRGARRSAGARPRDRARHGRGLRREAHRRGRPRGGTPRPLRPEARVGAVDARGGVHLGVLPAGGARRVPWRAEPEGRARGLGVHQHQPRRGGSRDPLRHPEREGLLRGLRLPPAPGVLSVPGGHRQQLRPRVLHGRAGGGGRRRSPRVPAGAPREPAAASRAREGREGVRLGRAAQAGDARARRGPRLRNGEGLGRRRLRRGEGRSLEGPHRGHGDLRGLRVRPHPEPREPPVAGAGLHRHGARRRAHGGDRVPRTGRS